MSYVYSKYPFLQKLNLNEKNLGCFNGKKWTGSSPGMISFNPTTNEPIANTSYSTPDEYEEAIQNMLEVKNRWMAYPMVKRGEIVAEIGEKVREYKNELGKLIALEMGKIEKEGIGEVQEVIDICN